MAKRYRRTGRRPRSGKKSRGKLRRKRTRRPRRISMKLFMRGGTGAESDQGISLPPSDTTNLGGRTSERVTNSLGGAIVINSGTVSVVVRPGYKEKGGSFVVATGEQYKTTGNECPAITLKPGQIGGIDQGTVTPSPDHQRALEITYSNIPHVVDRNYRDIYEITQDGVIKRGNVREGSPSLDAGMGKEQILSYVDGNMVNM